MFIEFHRYSHMENDKRVTKPFLVEFSEIRYCRKGIDNPLGAEIFLASAGKWYEIEENYEQVKRMIFEFIESQKG